MTRTYLVTGATGNVGKSVVSTLLSGGQEVHALTRSIASKSAQQLASLGATLFEGDFEDASKIALASVGCSGMFLIEIPGPNAVTFVQSALAAFQERSEANSTVVFMGTVFRGEKTTKLVTSPNSGLPHKSPHPFVMSYWNMADAAETAIQTSGFEHWTILRPAWFMSNYVDFAVRPIHWPTLAKDKQLVAGTPADVLWELNDPHDIGVFAAHALMEKGSSRWDHKCLELASELLTLEEKAQIMSRVSGIPIKAIHRPDDEATRLAEDDFVGYLHFWQRKTSPKVDMVELRGYGFKLGSFEDYLTRNKERLLEALNDSGAPQVGLSSDDILKGAGQHGH